MGARRPGLRWTGGVAAGLAAALTFGSVAFVDGSTQFEPGSSTLTLDRPIGELAFVPATHTLLGVGDGALMVVDPTQSGPPRVIRVKTNRVGGTVAADPATGTAWVGNGDDTHGLPSRMLSILDLASGRFVETRLLSAPVADLALDPRARRAYLLHRPFAAAPAGITVLDADSRAELAEVDLDFPADRLILTADGATAVVTGGPDAAVLSTPDLGVHRLDLQARSDVVAALDPTSPTGYLLSADTAYTVDLTSRAVRTAPSPAAPGRGQLAVGADGSLIMVAAPRVLVMNPRSRRAIASGPITDRDGQVVVDPATGTLFITGVGGSSVHVIGSRGRPRSPR
jgi:hypothetical protein